MSTRCGPIRRALVRTAPARLLAGLAARRRADAGPLTLIPCDNLPENGAVVARVVADLADLVEPGLRDWLEASVTTVTTMVDRITPRTTPEDRRRADDRCPVVTEPFSEWVLSGRFAGGRPRWEDAGAHVHGRHRAVRGAQAVAAQRRSLAAGLRRVGPRPRDGRRRRGRRRRAARGWRPGGRRRRVISRCPPRTSRAIARRCSSASRTRGCVTGWPRSPPTARRSSRSGSCPCCAPSGPPGACRKAPSRVLAAWIGHLRGAGVPVADPRADELVALAAGPLPQAVRRILEDLDPALAGDDELVAGVLERAGP